VDEVRGDEGDDGGAPRVPAAGVGGRPRHGQHGHAGVHRRGDDGVDRGLDLGMRRAAGPAERHRQVGGADQHAGDARNGADPGGARHRLGVLDLDDDDRVAGCPLDVLQPAVGAVAAGARGDRESAPAARRVVRGGDHRLGAGAIQHMRDDDAGRPRVERRADVQGLGGRHPHERRQPGGVGRPEVVLQLVPAPGPVLEVEHDEVEASAPGGLDLAGARHLREQRDQPVAAREALREARVDRAAPAGRHASRNSCWRTANSLNSVHSWTMRPSRISCCEMPQMRTRRPVGGP
jgi:hypothetical protein